MVAGKAVFLILRLLPEALARNPPAGHLFHVGGIGHIDNHEGIAIGALQIFQSQLVIPPAVEIGALAAVVEVVMSAVSLHAGVVFLKKLGIFWIGHVGVANAPQTLIGEHFVAQFLVVLAVGILGCFHRERLSRSAHHDPLLDFRVVG